MKSFFVTFGKGILYFLGMPFLIVFIVLYGVYLLGIFFATLFRTIVLYFQGKPTGIKDELDEKAMYILKQRRLGNPVPEVNQTSNTTNNNNSSTVNQTINNYNLGMDPNAISKLNEMQRQGALGQQNPNDIPTIDTTLKKVDAIDVMDEPDQLPFNNKEEE